MIAFKENKCRLCKKVFCCIKCRKKHEKTTHNVNPDCDICFYGEIVFKNLGEDLIEHILSQHWPLHCRKCKRMFGSIDELILHNLCPMSKKLLSDSSNKTPVRPKDANFDSPPVMYPFGDNSVNTNIIISVTNNILAVTTSTPMHNDDFLEKIPDFLTPVELNKKDIGIDSSLEIADESKGSASINRKVTISETQLTEMLTERSNKKVHGQLKGALKKTIDKGKEEINKKTSELPDDTIETWKTALTESSPPIRRNEVEVLSDVTNKLNSPDKKDRERIHEIKSLAGKNYVNEVHAHSTIWSSMTNIVKGVLAGFSSLSSYSKESVEEVTHEVIITKRRLSNKRLRSDTDVTEELKCFKRMKFTEIKCRKPINSTTPYKFLLEKKVVQVSHKSTQTEE